jgi:hypothetical protein
VGFVSFFRLLDRIVLDVILLFPDVKENQLGKIVKNLPQVQKGNSSIYITKRKFFYL